MDLCQQPMGPAALDEGGFKRISEKVEALFGSGSVDGTFGKASLTCYNISGGGLLAQPSDEDEGELFQAAELRHTPRKASVCTHCLCSWNKWGRLRDESLISSN